MSELLKAGLYERNCRNIYLFRKKSVEIFQEEKCML